MLDPIAIDGQFAALTRALPLYSSRRMRLLRLLEFAEPVLLSPSKRFLLAYLDELIPLLITSMAETDLTGTSVLFLERMLEFMDGISAEFPAHAKGTEWLRARQTLVEWITKVGRWAEGGGNAPRVFPVGHDHGVWIPFVEHERILEDNIPRFGTIRRMDIRVSPVPRSMTGDDVHVGNFAGSAASRQERLLPAIVAAKRVAARIMRRNGIPPLRVDCSTNHSELLEGESMEGGIAAGVVCSLLRALEHKETYAVGDNVAITGRIDESGRLMPVDEAGLRVKVEACVYSPVGLLVVPKEQEDFCRKFLHSIHPDPGPRTQDPESSLFIVGVSDLSDIFNNRLLVVSRAIPVLNRAARRVWRERRPVAVLVIGAMALLIARLAYGPMDKNPVKARFEGKMASFENAEGQVIQSIPVGARTVSDALQPGGRFAAFQDVDGDGTSEAFCAVAPESPGNGGFDICCWSLPHKRFLWRTPVVDSTEFPRHPSGRNIQYNVRQISVGDFDANGLSEVWVSANSTSFAHLVMKLDGSSGKVLGKYLHSGFLMGMLPVDLDRDGVTEIALCGMNNAYEQACLLLLDPRDMMGMGPTRGNYTPAGIHPATHRRYMLIPRTVVGEAFRDLERFNAAVAVVRTDEGNWPIRVAMLDVQSIDKSCFGVTSAFYYLDFDSTLTPCSMVTGNSYESLSKQLAEQGRIPFRPDTSIEYQRRYFQSFPSWDGKEWTTGRKADRL
jgi:hypothetical protein